MAFAELVQLDHRGINLRHLASWQDGDGGPVDGQSLPGVVRIRIVPGDVWDLSGPAAARFRAAIRELAWTPEGETPGPSDAVAGEDRDEGRSAVQGQAYDPSGRPVDPDAGADHGHDALNGNFGGPLRAG